MCDRSEMSGTRPLIYADSCIFIAWLQNEQRKPGEMEGVTGLVKAVDDREIILVTSVMTDSELIKLDQAQMAMYERFKRRRNVEVKAIDNRVSGLSREIRAYYQGLKDEGHSDLPTLQTPDAIHLATAIHWGCEKLFTFDENDEAGGSRPKRGLIPLSGTVAGKYQIEICMPYVPQLGLPF